MSGDKLDKISRTLENGLPNFDERRAQEYYVQEIHRDLAASRKFFEERIDQRPYSSTHPVGPFEASFNTEDVEDAIDKNTGELLAVNKRLRNMDGNMGEIAAISLEAVNELRLVREGTDILPGIDEKLSELNETAYRNLGIATIDAILARYEAGQLQCAAENANEYLNDISDHLDEIHDEIVGGFETVNENLENIHGEIADGFEVTNENLENIHEEVVNGFEATNENLDRINENMINGNRLIVGTVVQSAAVVQRAIDRGFAGLSQEVRDIRLEQRQAMSAVALAFQNFNTESDRRHNELVDTITDVAENRNALEADEKYKFALDQFNIWNYRGAIQELNAALLAQSTHCPSLILFGKIASLRAEWKDAKDSYYIASEIAFQNNDGPAYETAILALAHIETLVGNGDLGQAIIKSAVERWRKRWREEKSVIRNKRCLNIKELSEALPNLYCEYARISAMRIFKSIDVKAVVDFSYEGGEWEYYDYSDEYDYNYDDAGRLVAVPGRHALVELGEWLTRVKDRCLSLSEMFEKVLPGENINEVQKLRVRAFGVCVALEDIEKSLQRLREQEKPVETRAIDEFIEVAGIFLSRTDVSIAYGA